jgi:hypothetical protein
MFLAPTRFKIYSFVVTGNNSETIGFDSETIGFDSEMNFF